MKQTHNTCIELARYAGRTATTRRSVWPPLIHVVMCQAEEL